MILTLLNLVVSMGPPLVTVLALTYIAVRHQRAFLALFMVLTALDNTRDFAPTLDVTLGGITVYPEDLITVICIAAGLARIGHWRLAGIARTAALTYIALVGAGVISWIWVLGLQHGANSWRQEMLSGALLLYTTTRPQAWSWSDLRNVIVWPAIVVAIASGVGILLLGFGSSSSTVLVNGVMETARPAFAPGSLLMLAGLWITVLSADKWTATRGLVVLLLAGMVLLTQNRSVWVAAVLGIVVWWLVPRTGPGSISAGPRPVGLGGVSRTILVSLIAAATALVALSVANIGQSASNDETWSWRVARWANSMSIPRSWLEWLSGSAFGPTPASTPGVFPTYAHSFYVDSIEKTGFAGLAAALCLFLAVGRAYVPPTTGRLGLIVCASLLIYGISYQAPPWGWMLAGIFLSSTLTKQTGFRDTPPATVQDPVEPGNPQEELIDRQESIDLSPATYGGQLVASTAEHDH